MKKLFFLFAALLICMLLIVPLGAAFAEGDTADDGEMHILSAEDTSAETATTGAIDYSGVTMRSPVMRDENGKITNNYSTGLSCGASGVTLFTDHYYDLSFVYANKTDNSDSSIVPEIEIRDCPAEALNKYVRVNGGTVTIDRSPEPFSFTIAVLQNGEDLGSMRINVAKYKVDFSDILLLGIGVYALVTAITAKGTLFRNEFIKEGMEDDFRRSVRIAAAVVGLAMIAAALISIFGCTVDWLRWVKYALYLVAVIALIASLIITNRMTDKEKRAKAQATARTGGPTASSAAFEFDENEPTIDDVLANLNKDNNDNNAGE